MLHIGGNELLVVDSVPAHGFSLGPQIEWSWLEGNWEQEGGKHIVAHTLRKTNMVHFWASHPEGNGMLGLIQGTGQGSVAPDRGFELLGI